MPVQPNPREPKPPQGQETVESLRRGLKELERQISFAAPTHQIVDVTFNGTADADTDIAHDLEPATPEDIFYHVVQAATPCHVYHDCSTNRTPWSASVIRLRADVPAARVRLLLFVPSTPVGVLDPA